MLLRQLSFCGEERVWLLQVRVRSITIFSLTKEMQAFAEHWRHCIATLGRVQLLKERSWELQNIIRTDHQVTRLEDGEDNALLRADIPLTQHIMLCLWSGCDKVWHLGAGQARQAGNIPYREKGRVDNSCSPARGHFKERNKQLLKLRQLKLYWPSIRECKMIHLKETGSTEWRRVEFTSHSLIFLQ